MVIVGEQYYITLPIFWALPWMRAEYALLGRMDPRGGGWLGQHYLRKHYRFTPGQGVSCKERAYPYLKSISRVLFGLAQKMKIVENGFLTRKICPRKTPIWRKDGNQLLCP